jgi:hypothetical protein
MTLLQGPKDPVLPTLTFTALQMKAFGQKKIKFHAGVKKCHFGNFSEWAGTAVPN